MVRANSLPRFRPLTPQTPLSSLALATPHETARDAAQSTTIKIKGKNKGERTLEEEAGRGRGTRKTVGVKQERGQEVTIKGKGTRTGA